MHSTIDADFVKDQLIRYYGYEVDSYQVTTEDGYILTVFRCYSNEFDKNELKPIIIQHGMMDSSDSFCINPGIQSLGKHQSFYHIDKDNFWAYFFFFLLFLFFSFSFFLFFNFL